MKAVAILSVLSLAAAPIAEAKCKYQDVGFMSKKWRLSTYKSQSCINKVQDVTKSGFGTWCIDIPNTTRSFIFSVGGGYNELNLEQCTIFFSTSNTCSGDQVGRSNGAWLKDKLSTSGERMASAYVQCQRLFGKREGDAADGLGDRRFVRGDDGAWYEEVEAGVVVKARESAEELEAEFEGADTLQEADGQEA
ncbi:hypothetical protein C8A00DRAFT_31891 [Chaetomidium leptoderma]|uniref:Uncharacterized protein n=1 Tax=Chaetomidium leptoderma TaxID=669021 RepID=A0AAN7A018_9PEZI|nr:hypothetical protein C8A00DRAFT_31891 [Chaetomidium leptoderma]